MIAQNLGFNEDEFVSDDRVALAKYVVDIDLAMLKESVLLFSPDQVQINPMNVLQYIETLLDYSYAIAEMATVRAPVWCYDRIESFEIELQKLATYGDAGFKQKLVLLLRLFADAQERSDIAALADLFSGEVPSLLRSLAQNIKNGGLQHITA